MTPRETLEEEEEQKSKDSFEEFKKNKASSPSLTTSYSIHEEHEPERTELNPSIRILESKKRSYDILNPRANKRQRLSQNVVVPMAHLR